MASKMNAHGKGRGDFSRPRAPVHGTLPEALNEQLLMSLYIVTLIGSQAPKYVIISLFCERNNRHGQTEKNIEEEIKRTG